MAGFRERVLGLVDEGAALAASGEFTAAVERYRAACAAVREEDAARPGVLENLQQLGAMLYTLGEWLMGLGEFDEATQALTEAEEVYRRLDFAQLAADVVIRRARVHGVAGRPLSAIADVQVAVEMVLASPGGVDAARVVALGAQVQLLVGGDPDLAVAAADWAIREYVAGLRVGDQLSLPAAHVPALQAAGRVAWAVHEAAGRRELAQAASQFAQIGGEPFTPDELISVIRSSRPTLHDVLGDAGRADMRDALTAPATDVSLLVPSMRCSPQVAPARAQALQELQVSSEEAVQIFLGLEAHALFSAASRQQVVGMRYQFEQFGPAWAAAVVNFGQRYAEEDGWAAAVDAANWLTGILSNLFPHATINPRIRATILECAHWQHGVYTSVGNTVAAENVRNAAEMLEQFAG